MIRNARDSYEFAFDSINNMPTDSSLVALWFLWKYSLITFTCICSKNRTAHTFQTKSKNGKLIWHYSPEATRKKHYHFILLTMEIVSRKMNCSKAFDKIWILHWYKLQKHDLFGRVKIKWVRIFPAFPLRLPSVENLLDFLTMKSGGHWKSITIIEMYIHLLCHICIISLDVQRIPSYECFEWKIQRTLIETANDKQFSNYFHACQQLREY